MTLRRRDLFKGGVAAAGLVVLPALAQQQAGRIVTGFPPGGSVDLVARALADKLRVTTGRPWIVESKPGAGGRIAVTTVKDLPGDGNVILLTPSPMITMYPHTYKKLSYDPVTELVPIATAALTPYVLAVGPMLSPSVQTMKQLVGWLKDNKVASYGIPAAGTGVHMAGVILSQALGLQLQPVPYKGGAPMTVDLMGGQIPFGITVLSDVIAGVDSGRLRPLAVAGSHRSSIYPNVPTFKESGIPGLDFDDWMGAFMPRHTSAAVADAMNHAIVEALKHPDVQQVLRKNGLEPGGEPRAEFVRTVRQDMERWGPVVKASGFTAED